LTACVHYNVIEPIWKLLLITNSGCAGEWQDAWLKNAARAIPAALGYAGEPGKNHDRSVRQAAKGLLTKRHENDRARMRNAPAAMDS
jgi:hypothetical protein